MIALNTQNLKSEAQVLAPGVVVAVLVAIAAQFLSEHYDTPAMLLALLLCIALRFLSEEVNTAQGIGFSAKSLLRLGVALLGVRISVGLLLGLTPSLIALIIGGMLATIAFGLAIAPLFGHKWRFAFLTSGSVAICGASAAMAISAILPRDERSEERLLFTVLSVTVLSTIAMIAYPILAERLALGELAGGVFLGGTIHDVAQVVGAGYSVNDPTGDTATLVKLIRVAMLAPVVLVAAIIIRATQGAVDNAERPPLLPSFVIGFLILAALASLGLIPEALIQFLSHVSRWLLLIAIAAVGMKTNLKQVLEVGPAAIALVILETVFIAGAILVGLHFLT